MHLEVEQKFRLDSHDAIRRQLVELGARADEPVTQIDTYYGHPQRDFASTDEALRIRCVDRANWITYKGPKLSQTTKTRQEIDLAIASGERGAAEGAELLLALGFHRVAEVRKRRQSFHLVRDAWMVEVTLDEVRDLGRFVELEILADESGLEAASQVLGQVADELGLSRVERSSYLELLLESGG
jgi:adenylate cyclase class 2